MHLNRYLLSKAAALVLTGLLTACGGGGGSDPEPEVPLGTQVISNVSGSVSAGSYIAQDVNQTDVQETDEELNVTITSTLAGSNPEALIVTTFIYDKLTQKFALIAVENSLNPPDLAYICGGPAFVESQYECPADRVVFDAAARTIRFRNLRIHEHDYSDDDNVVPVGSPVNSLVLNGAIAWKAAPPAP